MSKSTWTKHRLCGFTTKHPENTCPSCRVRREELAREAAPELLEALKRVWDSTAVLNHLDPDAQQQIADAITKAEGREP